MVVADKNFLAVFLNPYCPFVVLVVVGDRFREVFGCRELLLGSGLSGLMWTFFQRLFNLSPSMCLILDPYSSAPV